MARFWVGGTGSISETSHWSATSGGAGGSSIPVSTENTSFDSASHTGAYTVTFDVELVTADLTIAVPAAGNPSFEGSSNINCHGSFVGLSTVGGSWSGLLNFNATATGKTVLHNNFTFGAGTHVTFNGVGGGWQLTGALTPGASRAVTLTNGALDTNGQTVTCSGFLSNNSNIRSLTLGASIINVTNQAGTGWNFTTTTNLTFSAGTSSIRQTSSGNFNGGGLTYNELQINGTACTVNGVNTFATLTRTGTATKTDTLTFGANQTITGTLTMNGNSITNRLFINSNVVGTARTLTAATVTVTNADFMDITGAGAGSWNLSAISGGSGDYGGNSSITFTTGAAQYWFKNTGDWSDASKWFLATAGGGGAGRVPLGQDSISFDASSIDAASQTITQDMPRTPSINWTGATNTPTFTTGVAFSIHGSLTLIAGMTLTASTPTLTFTGRGTSTLTMAGKTFARSVICAAPGGTLTMQDALAIGATNALTVAHGTFNANAFSVTLGTFVSNSGLTRTVSRGSATWTLLGNNALVWITSITGLTMTSATSTLDATYSGSTGTRSFTFLGGTLASFKVSAGTDTITNGVNDAVFTGNFDLTGFAGTFAGTGLWTIGGNFTMTAGVTCTSTSALSFNATSGTKTITTTGNTLANAFSFGGVGGTWQLVDALITTGTATLTNGTFDTNSLAVTSLSLVSTTAATRVLTMTNTTWTVTGTGNVWDFTSSANITINASNSTIRITNATATEKTFASGNKTFNDVVYAPGASTATLNFTGNGIVREIQDTGTAAHSIIYAAGSNFTFVRFRVYGSSGKLVTVGSTTASTHTLTCAHGPIICDFMSFSYSVATGGAVFFAGAQSTDGGNNTGWKFYGPARTAQGAGALMSLGVGHI